MAFYDLPKKSRQELVENIHATIQQELAKQKQPKTTAYFADEDTYIRKSAYLSIGRIFFAEKKLRPAVISLLNGLSAHDDFRVRQTVINAAGEIGKKDFTIVQHFFDTALFDTHHSPRNAVIGSVKKMGEVNPKPVLAWARQYLHHPDKEIRREICHGIELRGRKYPEDILSLLQELESDPTARVRGTLVHVLGQIAYKKGCLQKVVAHLAGWKNKALVKAALEEIIDVHDRYSDFAVLTKAEAQQYIDKHFPL